MGVFEVTRLDKLFKMYGWPDFLTNHASALAETEQAGDRRRRFYNGVDGWYEFRDVI